MPIFQDDLDLDRRPDLSDPEPVLLDPPPPKLRRLSEESLRTELCEGPVPDSPRCTPEQRIDGDGTTSSREELIERIKRGQSPTWIPARHVSHPDSMGYLPD